MCGSPKEMHIAFALGCLCQQLRLAFELLVSARTLQGLVALLSGESLKTGCKYNGMPVVQVFVLGADPRSKHFRGGLPS